MKSHQPPAVPTAVPSKERNIPILTGSNCLTNKDKTMLKCWNIVLVTGKTYENTPGKSLNVFSLNCDRKDPKQNKDQNGRSRRQSGQ